MAPLARVKKLPQGGATCIGSKISYQEAPPHQSQTWPPVGAICNGSKGAGASEAPGQTKEEFSINDTSRDPKVLKIGPQHG